MIVTPGGVRQGTVVLRGGLIAGIAAPGEPVAGAVIDAAGCHVLPGLIDIHCHIRAPAYPHRGSVGGETAACAAGGITTVFEMPITDPCCNSPDRVALRRDHFAGRAVVDFGLYAAPVDLDEAAVEAWVEKFLEAGREGLRAVPRDQDARFEAEKKDLLAKVGELTLQVDALKKKTSSPSPASLANLSGQAPNW
jgi:dihydroorotase-like cyclic amidohydrolase